jgi:hypothetical protein
MEAAVALERQVAVKLGGWRFREFVQPILLPFYETSNNDNGDVWCISLHLEWNAG